MSKKSKNINSAFPKKATPWPDLPHQLRDAISKQPSLLQNISYGSVKKSWSLMRKPCNLLQTPTLPQLHSTGDQNTNKPNIFDVKIHRGFAWYFKPCHHIDCEGQHFVGFSQGVLIGIKVEVIGCYFWDPFSSVVTGLPRWDNNIPFRKVVFSSSPKDYDVLSKYIHLFPRDYPPSHVLVVTGISRPAFVFCKSLGHKYCCYVPCTMPKSKKYYYDQNQPWIKQDCSLIDPHSSTQQCMQFINAIGFEGKFYALSLQGTLVVIEIMESSLRIASVSSSRAVPSIPSLHFKEYLIEIDREILVVFLISTKTTSVVDNIEIYRLLIPNLKWEKVENLKDKALFVGENSCMHVSASKIGCDKNCVYFSKRAGGDWFVYDMARGDISLSYGTSSTSSKWDEPIIEEEKIAKDPYHYRWNIFEPMNK